MFGIPLHVLIVHFPFVLVLAAGFCDARGQYRDGYRLTLWAGAGCMAAVLTGLLITAGSMAAVSTHASAALTTTIVTVVLAILRYSYHVRGEEGYVTGWFVVELLAVLGVLATAITGHRVALGGLVLPI